MKCLPIDPREMYQNFVCLIVCMYSWHSSVISLNVMVNDFERVILCQNFVSFFVCS